MLTFCTFAERLCATLTLVRLITQTWLAATAAPRNLPLSMSGNAQMVQPC